VWEDMGPELALPRFRPAGRPRATDVTAAGVEGGS
jgi:hypothetical protein